MANINFDDGYETFTINGDPKRVIRINPKDGNIILRFETAMRELKEETKKASGIKVNPDGTLAKEGEKSIEEGTMILRELNQFVNDKLNYIFNSDVTDAAFNGQSPLSVVGPENKFLFEVFIEAALETIREKMEESAEAVKKKTEKYTGKYIKASEEGKKYPYISG